MTEARLHSYVVNHDIGFAPNPFFGFCTLATCKQQIRRVAELDDWIVGTGAAKNRRTGYLVYAMRVTEVLSFDEYWNDERFIWKRPNLSGSRKHRFGDNVYHRDTSGDWIQEDSRHSRADGSPELVHLKRDTSLTERVLISNDFVYFGATGPRLPETDWGFSVLSGRGHRNRFQTDQVDTVVAWLNGLERGIKGMPFDWHRARNLARNPRPASA